MEEFTKSDLKNRMVVEYRNGERRMVVDNVLVGNTLFGYLEEYNDDLTNKEFSILDIMKVYDVICNLEALISPRCLRLLWQRSEVKEVTMAEVEEKFGCKVKIVKE